MNQITWLDWTQIDQLCSELATQISNYGFKPDVIVGIQRGGCIPAVLLSHYLDVKEFCVLGIRTTASNEIKAERTQPIVTGQSNLTNIKDKKVLLVDDVTNTGTTLNIAQTLILQHNPMECKTAVIVWDGDAKDKCDADFYATYTPTWVVFPWEKHGTLQ